MTLILASEILIQILEKIMKILIKYWHLRGLWVSTRSRSVVTRSVLTNHKSVSIRSCVKCLYTYREGNNPSSMDGVSDLRDHNSIQVSIQVMWSVLTNHKPVFMSGVWWRDHWSWLGPGQRRHVQSLSGAGLSMKRERTKHGVWSSHAERGVGACLHWQN